MERKNLLRAAVSLSALAIFGLAGATRGGEAENINPPREGVQRTPAAPQRTPVAPRRTPVRPGVAGAGDLTIAPWTRIAAVDAAVAKYNQKNDVPGLAVVVRKGGRELYAKGFGFADQAANRRATADTLFRLASVSKSVSGILAMELRERQQNPLVLTRKTRQYLPSLPAHHTHTVAQLLSQQSGIRHYSNGTKLDNPDFTPPANDQYASSGQAMNLFMNDPLVCSPGSQYSYSTHAFTVLGAVMERVSGAPFPLYAAQRFNAWGLEKLRPETMSPRAGRAQVYEQKNGANVVADRDNISWKYPCGGFESSAREMSELGTKLLDGVILRQATLNTMWTAQSADDGPTTYGLGWSIGSQNGNKIVAHSGSQVGAASYWLIYPDDDIVVTVLSNRNGHSPGGLAKWIGRAAVLPANAALPAFNP